MATKHSNLRNYALVKFSEKCIVWGNETGTGLSMDGSRIISFGKKGSSDIIGFVKATGQFIGIEVKIPPDKLRPEQKIFQEVLTKNNALFFVVKSHQDVDDALFSI